MAHRTIEKRDVRSSAARKIAGVYIDRIVARKICICARCGQNVVNAPLPLGVCESACECMRLHRVVPSIINTQSYGRLNAGLPSVSGPIIICGIVRVGPISKTATGRDLCADRQSTKSFCRVIISALPLLAVRFPVVRAISMRLVHRADELPGTLRIGRHCRRLFDRLIATAVHTQTKRGGALEKRTVLHFIGFL